MRLHPILEEVILSFNLNCGTTKHEKYLRDAMKEADKKLRKMDNEITDYQWKMYPDRMGS